MEGRLLRPPLASTQQPPQQPLQGALQHHQRPHQQPPQQQPVLTYAAKAASPRSTTVAPTTQPPVTVRKQGRKKPPTAAKLPSAAANRTLPVAPPRNPTEWETVGASKKAANKRRRAAKKRLKAEAKIRAPRSTAVVLTLQPEALERGTTYADLLKKARSAIDPSKLGISAGLRCKTTQTGARLIEVPGASSSEQADKLADSLRQILPAEEVRVSRPQKCAEVRIAGLDDSVVVEEVVEAIAKAGECPPAHIRCGTIRPGRTGMGTVIVSCPVAVAKKLADGRRILIGWVSAQVRLLAPRPLKCYRCLSSGHVGIRCTSAVDCSGRCFRCGKPNHTAGTCQAPPHCILCEAAGKPAAHRAGTKNCVPPKKPPSSGHSAKNKVAAPAVGNAEVTSMETI